jgi:hypothetical protein
VALSVARHCTGTAATVRTNRSQEEFVNRMLAKAQVGANAIGANRARPAASTTQAHADTAGSATARHSLRGQDVGRSQRPAVDTIEIAPDDWEDISRRKNVWEGSAFEAQPQEECGPIGRPY